MFNGFFILEDFGGVARTIIVVVRFHSPLVTPPPPPSFRTSVGHFPMRAARRRFIRAQLYASLYERYRIISPPVTLHTPNAESEIIAT